MKLIITIFILLLAGCAAKFQIQNEWLGNEIIIEELNKTEYQSCLTFQEKADKTHICEKKEGSPFKNSLRQRDKIFTFTVPDEESKPCRGFIPESGYALVRNKESLEINTVTEQIRVISGGYCN